ncbi:MAG: hypothetical protein ABSB95_10860 [Dissulfurispiraceae bacterium]|jgi:hypothetical protein
MNTLFDFVTHIKGVEYLASVSFIAVYLIYSEFLKPRPFSTVVQAGKEDIEYLRKEGSHEVLKTMKRVITAPFVGLMYVAMLPFAFLLALVSTVANKALGYAGKEMSFGWRPIEAYLSGKKSEGKKKTEKK